MADKRRYHRMKVEVPLQYRVPPSTRMISTATLDISGTGVVFRTPEEVRVRQELLLYLMLPGQERVEVHARVVRVEREAGADPSSPEVYRAAVRIVDPIKFDEKKFVKFYSEKMLEFFGRPIR